VLGLALKERFAIEIKQESVLWARHLTECLQGRFSSYEFLRQMIA